MDELIKFQSDNEATLGTAEREVKQAIEKGENNLAWMEENYSTIFDFLKKQNDGNKK